MSDSQLLLLESRIQTNLLKQILRWSDDNTEQLRSLLSPVVTENRVDREITAKSGEKFSLSDLPSTVNSFAKSYIVKKLGEEYCQTAFIEPQSKCDRTPMNESAIQDLRDVLDSWFTAYNWKAVRLSVNQHFRDLKNKQA
jgi:hypothetical protein